MASIVDVPDEVLLLIIQHLSLYDCGRLAVTCSRLWATLGGPAPFVDGRKLMPVKLFDALCEKGNMTWFNRLGKDWLQRYCLHNPAAEVGFVKAAIRNRNIEMLKFDSLLVQRRREIVGGNICAGGFGSAEFWQEIKRLFGKIPTARTMQVLNITRLLIRNAKPWELSVFIRIWEYGVDELFNNYSKPLLFTALDKNDADKRLAAIFEAGKFTPECVRGVERRLESDGWFKNQGYYYGNPQKAERVKKTIAVFADKIQ